MSADSEPTARSYGRRADAERNRESVLDHSVRLLSEDPAAEMAEIADQAGISRATLYRHFSTREDLIEAIAARAMDDVERAIAASRLDEGSAREALQRLIATLLEVEDRYRFLISQEVLRTSHQHDSALGERVEEPIRALFERGRAAGEFSQSLSADWMMAAFGALLVAVAVEIARDRLDPRDGQAFVSATLLHGL